MILFTEKKHAYAWLVVLFLSLQPSHLDAKLTIFTLGSPDLELLVNPTETNFNENILVFFSVFLKKDEFDCLGKALKNRATNCSINASTYCTKVMVSVDKAVKLYSRFQIKEISINDKLEFLNLIASGFGFGFKIVDKRLLN